METLYFTLGIASVVVMAFAVGTIWVMFKVSKINSRLRDNEYQFGSTHRAIETVEQTIMNNMNNNLNELDTRFNEVYAQADRMSNETNQLADQLTRYIDSRIDKLAAQAAKELING